MRSLVSCLALLVACSDEGSPRQDAASNSDASPIDAAIDAPAVCAVPGECPCFSNDDCPDSTRCHAADPGMIYCEPGPGGSGAPGSVCTGENDCTSALCVDGSDVMRCSRTCMTQTDCPAELPRCLGGLGICVRNP